MECLSMWRSGERVSVDGVIGGQESKVPLRWEAEARRYVEMLLLVLICGWGYFANLHLSLLEGSEGLYAGIAGEMGRRNEFFDLTYHGEPYFNKPPLFFWLLHWATSLWGDQEIALRDSGLACGDRHGGARLCLGDEIVVLDGRILGGARRGHQPCFLWYGRRVLFDSTLTFPRHAGPVRLGSGADPGPQFTMVSPGILQYGARGDVERDARVFLPCLS